MKNLLFSLLTIGPLICYSQNYIENTTVISFDEWVDMWNNKLQKSNDSTNEKKVEPLTDFNGWIEVKSRKEIILTQIKNSKIEGYRLLYKRRNKLWSLKEIDYLDSTGIISTWQLRKIFDKNDTLNLIKTDDAILKVKTIGDKTKKSIKYDFKKETVTEYYYNWATLRKFKTCYQIPPNMVRIDYSNSKIPNTPGVLNENLEYFSFIRYNGVYSYRNDLTNDTLTWNTNYEFRFQPDKTLKISYHQVYIDSIQDIDTVKIFNYKLKEVSPGYTNTYISSTKEEINVKFEPFGLFVEFPSNNQITWRPCRFYIPFKRNKNE